MHSYAEYEYLNRGFPSAQTVRCLRWGRGGLWEWLRAPNLFIFRFIYWNIEAYTSMFLILYEFNIYDGNVCGCVEYFLDEQARRDSHNIRCSLGVANAIFFLYNKI